MPHECVDSVRNQAHFASLLYLFLSHYHSAQVTEGTLKCCQRMEMNVFCLCTWSDLSCFSPSYIIARALGLSLYRAGVLYLEPDLYTNTHTTRESAMSVPRIPRPPHPPHPRCHNCQQYNHLPTLHCAFKDNIKKEREKPTTTHESR